MVPDETGVSFRSAALPVSMFTAEVEAFGGAERSLLALSKWMGARGVANEIVTYYDRAGLERYASHAVKVVQLRPEGGVRAKLRSLRAYIAGRNEAGVPATRFLASGYQAALHSTLAGAREFHTLMHDTAALLSDASGRSFKGRLRIGVSNRMIGFGLRSGGVTLVTSEFLQRECRRDFRVRARIARMGGLAASTFRERPVDGKLRMLSVSRVEANKRIDWLLDSLASLERGPGSVVVGDGLVPRGGGQGFGAGEDARAIRGARPGGTCKFSGVCFG